MKLNLAFVCTASICRSPVMHFTFLSEVSGRPKREQWTVASRGTQARHSRICELGASVISKRPGGEAFARAHRPNSITGRFVAAQHILLTATRTERSILAALNPDSRARTFTIREATWLGEAALSASELERANDLVGGRGLAPLEAYADLLNGRRGLTPIPTTTWAARIGLGGADSHPLDIRDGHNASSRAHLRTMDQAVDHAQLLARQTTSFLDALG